MKDIRSYSKEELREAISALGEPSFRANQIHEWLWKKAASSFDEMTNLSKELREKLSANFSLSKVKQKIIQQSKDGTIKIAMELHDNRVIEGVMIPDSERNTACVSSQVGCTLSCKFCATGFLKRERNLTAGEI